MVDLDKRIVVLTIIIFIFSFIPLLFLPFQNILFDSSSDPFGFFGILFVFSIIGFVLNIFVAILIYKNEKNNNLKFLFILPIFFGFIGALIYIIIKNFSSNLNNFVKENGISYANSDSFKSKSFKFDFSNFNFDSISKNDKNSKKDVLKNNFSEYDLSKKEMQNKKILYYENGKPIYSVEKIKRQ